jgi:hypothetical protein
MTNQFQETTDTPYPVCNDFTKVASLLKEYGVCVIPDVFSSSECDSLMNDILLNTEVLSGNQVDHNQPEQWTGDNLPPQIRYGMYHNLLNNLKPAWEIRRDPRMKSIFKPVYSELRGTDVDEFVCSMDGINIQPNIARKSTGEKDWPHCDQTERSDIFKCVQGQVVLTNTTASFRATPKSHKHFVDIMKIAGVPDDSRNFMKFTDEQLDAIQENIVLPNNISWQVPIKANKGSVILWLSTTVHSGMSSEIKETPTKEDPFIGWRGVVYVCYRPKSEFNEDELKVLEDCLENNHGTNHWSTKVFSSKPRPADLYARKQVISPTMEKLVANPQLVYEQIKFKPHKSSFLIN